MSFLAVAAIFKPLPSFKALSADQERALKPKDTFRECRKCPEMIVAPPGSFTMGSPEDEVTNDWDRGRDEGPQHIVTFNRVFAVGKVEVTVDQFAAFIKETGYDTGWQCLTFERGRVELRSGRSFRNPGYRQSGSYPATCLNWDDAKAYVAWLSHKTGKTYRLLSEAEWEYAARAGAIARYVLDDNKETLCRHANGGDQTLATERAKKGIANADGRPKLGCSDNCAYTAPVGSFIPNVFGLHDVLGNVEEWVEDCYHDSFTGAPADGSAWVPGDCEYRISRGGAWYDHARDLRVARRNPLANNRGYGCGLRVARTLAP
jgi:formylglycine-generating enzyme required for sulfatase activity